MKNFIFIGLLFISACSGVKMLSPDRNVADQDKSIDTKGLYTQDFLRKINHSNILLFHKQLIF